ncbi:MAG: ATP-binding cassette domain-containing protein [Anaerolineales bacterium]|nr:ATP-binding cassette domain-containing protein [Deltaproteobacteria bacterium]NIS79738.1 ATP-binding cassette domain-containing protein [Anaerolineales bacterium]
MNRRAPVAELKLSGITKTFGDVVAVDNVSLDIASGEFVTLVGASGCGKTTLLRVIAGFTKPDKGGLTINGRRVDNLPPSKREIGFVFQSYALFPTQTIAQNIGFSLNIRRKPKAEIAKRVGELCALTELTGLEDRYPHELSGGQQQRVALARALAPNPSILLLDEPLAALDAKIRAHLRVEIRALIDRLGITTVYVTHDQEEALSISDRVAVMDYGKILQVGAPMDVYLRPTGDFVAQFIGSSNNLRGRLTDDGTVMIQEHPLQIEVPEGIRGQDTFMVCLRPEHINLSRAGVESGGMPGKVTAVSFLGQTVRVRVATPDGTELLVDVATSDWLTKGLSVGDEVAWAPRPGSAMVFSHDDVRKEV